MVGVYIIYEMPHYINGTNHTQKKQMFLYHPGPKLAIPYCMLPEVLICQDKDPGIVLIILTMKIENHLFYCSKRHQ